MTTKITYHAICKTDIKEFNSELKEYTDQGYVPFGSLAISSIYRAGGDGIITTYAILLSKLINAE